MYRLRGRSGKNTNRGRKQYTWQQHGVDGLTKGNGRDFIWEALVMGVRTVVLRRGSTHW